MDENERILVLGVSFHAALESRLEQLVLWLMAWLTRVGVVPDRGAVSCMDLFTLDALMAGVSIMTHASFGS